MKCINNTLIILCILFISCNIQITGNHLSYMKFRNYVLRTLMSKEYINFKKMLEVQNIKIRYLKNITSKTLLKIYDTGLSKYYDLDIAYNSLSEDDKIILETVLSLLY